MQTSSNSHRYFLEYNYSGVCFVTKFRNGYIETTTFDPYHPTIVSNILDYPLSFVTIDSLKDYLDIQALDLIGQRMGLQHLIQSSASVHVKEISLNPNHSCNRAIPNVSFQDLLLKSLFRAKCSKEIGYQFFRYYADATNLDLRPFDDYSKWSKYDPEDVICQLPYHIAYEKLQDVLGRQLYSLNGLFLLKKFEWQLVRLAIPADTLQQYGSAGVCMYKIAQYENIGSLCNDSIVGWKEYMSKID